jgi:hypothetical protein
MYKKDEFKLEEKKGKSCGETEFIGDIASFTRVRIPSPALSSKGRIFLG